MAALRNSAERLLLLENFAQNVAGGDTGAVVDTAPQCVPNFLTPQHPGKRNNYLFLDGHVAGMTFLETLPPGTNPVTRPVPGNAWSRY